MKPERIYYHIVNNVRQIHERVAKFNFDKSWLWAEFEQDEIDFILKDCNDETFLGMFEYYDDLNELHNDLQELLDKYADFYSDSADKETLIKQWLDQTQFLCATEYRKTKIVAHKEIIKWIKKYRIKNSLGPVLDEALSKQRQISHELLKTSLDLAKRTEKPQISFIQKDENFKDWIMPDFKIKFMVIEKELFDRGYIDSSYNWQKPHTQRELIELLCVLRLYKYFKPIVKGKKCKEFHYRQFISKRYGFIKTGLTETAKKYKPTLKLSEATFHWINKPD